MTARQFSDNTLVIATHNKGKLGEIKALFEPLGISILSAHDCNLDEPEETGKTFAENASLKSIAAAKKTKKVCLGDDSGVSINALSGMPGIYTSRWADNGTNYPKAFARIQEALGENPTDLSAEFVSCLALSWPDGHTEICEGRVPGKLTFPPRGENNFGYAPIFIPDGYDITFAQMDFELKNRIDQRALAFDLLLKKCFAEYFKK